MQAPPSQDEIDLYNEYWNTLSGNSNTQVIPDNIIVNFYKASNLNNQCLEEIWKLSNPNNVKSISKAEFFLGVRLIALAQKGYNVSNLPMNITIPQPMFMGYENVLRQFQNKKMLNQQSSFNSMGMNSQPISQQHNLLTSSYMSNSSNTSKIHSFSNNTSPVEWFIRQAKRSEYSNTFDKFQKNNVFQYKSLQDLVKDDPVNENDLDKIWSLLDKYNIKVIRKGQFIIFMHILESCKSGDAIPSSLPYSIIQSVGAAQEMEDRTVPAEPDLMSSSVNNNDSNKFDFFNNGNNDNNKTSSTSFFDSNNNNSTSFFNNNNNNNSNNNDSTSFFNNTNNNNNSSNNDSTSFFNNTNNNNNNNNNSTSFFNNNNNMNNNNSNSNDFFNSNNNNNANANTNNQNSFFNNTSTSNENNNLFGNSGKPSMNTPAINVASLEDYSNLLEYKKKYLENLKSDISKLQTSIDNLNNNKYSNPSIYSKLEDLIQNMNNETTEINNCKRDIQ